MRGGACLSVLVVAAAVAACSGPTAAATPATGPHSNLADITLPAGSTGGGGGSSSGTYGIRNELWQVSTPYDYTIQYLRQQLPILQSYEGMGWCAEDIYPGHEITQWSWGDTREMLVIAVNRDAPDVSVSISRGPDPVGC